MEDSIGKKHRFLHIGLLSLLFLPCIQGIPSRSVALQPLPRESQRNEFASSQNLGLIATDPKASEIWKQFSRDGRYRVASREELKMSQEKYHPYGDGDFNRDHQYYDFAVIVVDTMKTDVSRFGIVIFNSRKGRLGYDGPLWLYRESDLSRASLGTSSHGPLVVAEYRDDATFKACVVKWSLQQKKYRCEKAR